MTKTQIAAELFGEPVNNAVIRLPGRAFPGVLVQGDTLASLLQIARDAERLTPKDSAPDLVEAVTELRERLEATLLWYERALSSAGMPLPYVKVT
ncbi:MAG: hypothetical protein JST00_04885 [Deltaproteobacteria bacterium]|nr:hypothetical protein [Deltaproteobacteria bacterium]